MDIIKLYPKRVAGPKTMHLKIKILARKITFDDIWFWLNNCSLMVSLDWSWLAVVCTWYNQTEQVETNGADSHVGIQEEGQYAHAIENNLFDIWGQSIS